MPILLIKKEVWEGTYRGEKGVPKSLLSEKTKKEIMEKYRIEYLPEPK